MALFGDKEKLLVSHGQVNATTHFNLMRSLLFSFPRIIQFVAVAMTIAFQAGAAPRTLDRATYHLRSGTEPEWQEFAGKVPHGRRLDLRFAATTNTTEATLLIRQSDVKLEWNVKLNGHRLGKLFLMEAPLVCAVPIPPGALQNGTNMLSIIPPTENDDILVGDFKLDSRSLGEACESTIEVQVTDSDSWAGLPCRITVVDEQGALAALAATPGQHLAARPGVVYTSDGRVRIGVLPGRYTLYASRGFEYGLATRSISAAVGKVQMVNMRIRREVPTPGLASCDTHIHTFTFAKHGDATLDERMLTLAGEGIELPVSTEHNSLVNYAEPAKRLGLESRFTPLLGCEVTTHLGHFNAFPIQPGSTVADATLQSWPKLMDSIRSMPGVQVVVLNHPRDVHDRFIPFAPTNFNAVTGENRRGFEFTFNALELINSGALRSDWKQVYQDWFALLNHGCRITGVAASDSHDVSRFIVGQGRTYVQCRDERPGTINVEEACQSLLQGRALVSLGLLTQMKVDDRFSVGDLATGLGDNLRVTITVLGPSWTTVDRVELYANGLLIRERHIKSGSAAGEKAKLKWTLPRPRHDVFLVAIASGPGVKSPHWAIPRPYQPTSRNWEPRVIGSTNPIWVDGDGDGKFTPARDYAQNIIEHHGPDPATLLPALANFDEAVAIQAASLCQSAGKDVRTPAFTRLLQQATPAVQRGFAAFAASIDQASPGPEGTSQAEYLTPGKSL